MEDNDDPRDYLPDEGKYNPRTVNILRVFYVVVIIVWIILVWRLKLYQTDNFGKFIIAIPLIVWIISFYYLSELTVETEGKVFGNTYISVAIMVIIPLMTWTHDNIQDERLVNIMILAIVFAVFSLLDIWIPERHITFMRHLRSVFQVASLTLIAYAIYNLYIVYPHKKIKKI